MKIMPKPMTQVSNTCYIPHTWLPNLIHLRIKYWATDVQRGLRNRGGINDQFGDKSAVDLNAPRHTMLCWLSTSAYSIPYEAPSLFIYQALG